MIIEELDVKKRELPLFIDLKRCRLTYRIYKYIDMKGKCTINDIKNDTGANLKTIYRHIRYLSEKHFIDKDFSCEKKKDGAHFFVVTTPSLKSELNKIKKMAENF